MTECGLIHAPSLYRMFMIDINQLGLKHCEACKHNRGYAILLRTALILLTA